METDFTYISFGAGLQSSALLVMSALELRHCPRADLALFADTQSEPEWVHEHLGIMRDWAAKHGIEVRSCTRGNLGEQMLQKAVTTREEGGRFVSVPLWLRGQTGEAVPGRRQCTKEFKVQVLERAIREHLGYQPRQHVKHRVRALIGISWDERQRMKWSATPWVTNCYPLCEQQVTVAGCQDLLRQVGLPLPRKSACWFCPYHDDAYWATVKENHPDLWQMACHFDETIRDQSKRGLKSEAFVHRSLTPLRMAELDPGRDPRANPAFGLFDGFREECDGLCGV